MPDSDKLIVENIRRAEAESYFQTGGSEAGEKAFQSLAGDFPGLPRVYIGWGDMYCLFRNRDKMD
ncbi:MAG: hypothetical protein K6U80_13855 [Firmicutes bacterium]|nr:hypothetical protein [Bacillota bacterium]